MTTTQLRGGHADAHRVESTAQENRRATLSKAPVDRLLEDFLELIGRVVMDPVDFPGRIDGIPVAVEPASAVLPGDDIASGNPAQVLVVRFVPREPAVRQMVGDRGAVQGAGHPRQAQKRLCVDSKRDFPARLREEERVRADRVPNQLQGPGCGHPDRAGKSAFEALERRITPPVVRARDQVRDRSA